MITGSIGFFFDHKNLVILSEINAYDYENQKAWLIFQAGAYSPTVQKIGDVFSTISVTQSEDGQYFNLIEGETYPEDNYYKLPIVLENFGAGRSIEGGGTASVGRGAKEDILSAKIAIGAI